MAITTTEAIRLAHLLRRAGFGTRPADWEAYAALGVAGTTSLLLHPETVTNHADTVMHEVEEDFFKLDDRVGIQHAWLYRMARSEHPLEEKMTLFWHNHFATADYKVDNPRLMWRQNQMLRRNALGSFRTLLKGVAVDPAMLIWLDGGLNKKEQPNENFGRELLELFTLGVSGGYSEADVKEASRTFTGWQVEDNKAVFHPENYDDGIKRFLGQTGAFTSDDIIDILVKHPATGRLLATKLFCFFAHDAPTPKEIDALAHTFLESGYSIRAVVAQILRSPAFFSEVALYRKWKSPAELTITLLRTLDAPLTTFEDLPDALASMGQDLFNPPNVKGWREGQAWINTQTMIVHMSQAAQFVDSLGERLPFHLQTALQASGRSTDSLDTPDKAIDALWALLLPGRTPAPGPRKAFQAYLRDAPGDDGKVPDFDFLAKAPGLLSLILMSPEYQLA